MISTDTLIATGIEEVAIRVKSVCDVFTADYSLSDQKRIYDAAMSHLRLVDGKDPGNLLRGRPGSLLYDTMYVDMNLLHLPAVEHEVLHFLGISNLGLSQLPYIGLGRRILNQHNLAANAVVTLLDTDDHCGYHSLGIAERKDRALMRLYTAIPIEIQERTPCFLKTCFRIGNEAREKNLGLEYIHHLSR